MLATFSLTFFATNLRFFKSRVLTPCESICKASYFQWVTMTTLNDQDGYFYAIIIGFCMQLGFYIFMSFK